MAIAAEPQYDSSGTVSPLERLYDEARQIRRAILDAETPDEADIHRRHLDEVENRIELAERSEACEGFPPGK